MKEGAEVHAGKNTRFLSTDAEDKRYEHKVNSEERIEKSVNPDTKKYLLLLYTVATSLLSHLGYSNAEIYDAVRGHNYKSLTES